MIIGWIIGGIVVLLVIIFIYYYNRLVVLDNRIDNSLSQIDVQLKKRADLVPNLIETVKGYAKHEKKIIEDVTKARVALLKAGNELNCNNLIVITDNYESEDIIEWFGIKRTIKFIPLWKWLTEK